jgi:hypothetical protein
MFAPRLRNSAVNSPKADASHWDRGAGSNPSIPPSFSENIGSGHCLAPLLAVTDRLEEVLKGPEFGWLAARIRAQRRDPADIFIGLVAARPRL